MALSIAEGTGTPAADRARARRRRRAWPRLVYSVPGLLVLVVALFCLAFLAVALAPQDHHLATWWPAAGLSIIALLWAPRDRRVAVVGAVVLASLAANLVVGRTWPLAAGLSLSNASEAVVVAHLLRRGRSAPRLQSLEDVTLLVGATVVGALVMGLGAGLTTLLTATGDPWITARTVISSHGAAVLVLVPLGLRGAAMPRGADVGRRLEVTAQWCCLLAAVGLVFMPGQSLPLSFLPPALLVWGALRLSVRTVSVQLFLAALLINVLTRLGGGPFAAGFEGESTLAASLVQTYVVVLAVITLPLAVSVGQRRAALERVAASERLFRRGFSDALLGMVLLRRSEPARPGDPGSGGREERGLDVVELNDIAARLLGGGHDELVGSSWTDAVDEEHRPELLEAARAMVDGDLAGWHGEVSLTSALGRRWVEVALSPLSAQAGDGLFVAQVVDVTGRREAEDRLRAQALRDSLTGLGNRVLLQQRIDAAIAALPTPGPVGGTHDGPHDEGQDRGDGGPPPAAPGVALLFCDLDDFKLVNDSAGHTSGDEALVEVASRLRAVLRPGDVAARLGGDEFVVLRPRAGDTLEARALAEEVLGVFREPVVVADQAFALGASIGIAWGTHGTTADDLLRDADAAMYAAKAEGKRRAVVFSDEHRASAVRSARLEQELRTAVERGELEMFLQPVTDLRDGRTVAAEALVRWWHPERGLLAPGEWLDVAESSGLMPQIGAWVLRRSCEIAATWPELRGQEAPAIHVNVSARQLEVAGFVDDVRAVLEATGLEPGRLVLEFTETHLDTVSDRLLADLASLRDLGIGLAADDYGTGYSPLTRVIDLPISMIKIDRRFVAAMLDDVRSQAVVTTLVRLSDSLGLALVAEGVETAEQAQALRLLGCTTGQGYLWCRPVPEAEFWERLHASARA
ncbi:bifunctional diguanylate cyclase/phosphodiesterase [Actinotalea subterranea]|uniref:bifunctional diguanylate cyclase/phosphodiesterase n=1 Tax=Actinotalea subterranea TaxID=2607497 RepID=UPI0011EFA1C6|nr:EAL domain-containing protein [Actinotalea subterranea]